MTRWAIEFQPEAEEDLARLSDMVRGRVIDKLDWLEKKLVLSSSVISAIAVKFIIKDNQ